MRAVCTATSPHYFDRLDSRCYSCGNVEMRAALVFCLLLVLPQAVLFVASAGGTSLIARLSTRITSRRHHPMEKLRVIHKVWRRAGMRFKLKALVGLYQCFAAVPSVYNVVAPPGLEEFNWCASSTAVCPAATLCFSCQPTVISCFHLIGSQVAYNHRSSI